MKNDINSCICLALLICGSLYAANEPVRFARYFTDGTVLQRNKPVTIKGFAQAGAKVTVTFAGQSEEARADKNGAWEVTLNPVPASKEGRELICSAGDSPEKQVLKDVVVGDVILFARQTTVDVSLGRDEAGKKAASKAGDAGFRVIRMTTVPAEEPMRDLPEEASSGWKHIDEQEALKMSAAAFYMAEGLGNDSNVPVGIVDLNMGYYFPIAWMSREDLLETGKVMPKGTGKDLYQADDAVSAQVGVFTRDLDAFRKDKPKADESSDDSKVKSPVTPVSPLEDPRFPAAGYNSVMNPLRGMAFKAVVLQLGNNYPYMMYQKIAREGNALSRAWLGWAYERTYDIRKWCIYLEPWTIPRMVPQWRLYFEDPELPFGLVMPSGSDLATLAEHHCWIRELQRKAAETYSGVGLIMPGTEQVPFSAQPADEKLLGERVLSWVRGVAYSKDDIVSSGPLFDRFVADYSKATVFFKKGTAEGLAADKKALEHFEVAGTDAVYYPAKAEIKGSTILLECDKVNRIANVRYNWKHKPDQGLRNAAGLPA